MVLHALYAEYFGLNPFFMIPMLKMVNLSLNNPEVNSGFLTYEFIERPLSLCGETLWQRL